MDTTKSFPDIFTFENGTRVETANDWQLRAAELRELYERTMYGVWRSGENVTFTVSDEGARSISFFGDHPAEGAKNLTIQVSVGARTTAWSLPVYLPDPDKVPMPEGGYPFIVSMHGLPSMEAALSQGFAVLANNSTLVATDDTRHLGSFYELYPYETAAETQTGVLMAWAWGASKILDAIYNGAGKTLGLNPSLSIVTGVSRWGKATAVCGAYDARFRLVAPSCSGAGGLALYRYFSEGKKYDFSTKGASAEYVYGQNEPLSCLQSDAERGWFNDAFLHYASPFELPVEQYELAALSAAPNRCLFLIASCTGEDWVNAPSMWECYCEVSKLFHFLSLEDNLACNFHKEGHAVIEEDFLLMLPYFNKMIRGIDCEVDMEGLHTSVFALPQNRH